MTNRKTISEEFTEKIIEQLKAGTAPWQKPWKPGEFFFPFNPQSGPVDADGQKKRMYNGVNIAVLAGAGFADPRWLTFKQANDIGLKVKKGEKSEKVVFWQWTKQQDVLDENGKLKLDENGKSIKETIELTRPILLNYSVFNAAQLHNELGNEVLPPIEYKAPDWDPHKKIDEIVKNLGVSVTHEQRDRAFYKPFTDSIHMPSKDSFPDQGSYYSTLLHEICHATGHETRFNRTLGSRGTESHAKEEIRAEIAAWMLCTELGLAYDPGQNVAYVAEYVKVLQNDPYEIAKACQVAEKIKGYVMGLGIEKKQEVDAIKADLSPEKQKEESKTNDEFKFIISVEKTFLKVAFKEKEEAKKSGAKWDNEAKLWFAPQGSDLKNFEKWLPENVPIQEKKSTTLGPQEEFAQALKQAGLKIDGLPTMNGQIQRVGVEGGKKGAIDGAYCAFSDGRPNGWINNHKTGEKIKWVATGQVLTDEEKTALKIEAEARLKERELRRQKNYEKAAKACNLKFEQGADATAKNLYLVRKGVEMIVNQDKGIKENPFGNLLIPGRDIDGNIKTIQTISPTNGEKRFEFGSQKHGAMHIVGLIENKPSHILICEGFATGASLKLAMDKPVVVAFDSNNLKPVALALSEKYPDAKLIICA
ncbi:MAG: zincin-like metallopeptidase domain-containing protein, partial [Candidatus Adiutrix sp.]